MLSRASVLSPKLEEGIGRVLVHRLAYNYDAFKTDRPAMRSESGLAVSLPTVPRSKAGLNHARTQNSSFPCCDNVSHCGCGLLCKFSSIQATTPLQYPGSLTRRYADTVSYGVTTTPRSDLLVKLLRRLLLCGAPNMIAIRCE
jgi:hypothetical protein